MKKKQNKNVKSNVKVKITRTYLFFATNSVLQLKSCIVRYRNALLKQPGDEDPDEGVRDLVELVLRKLDVDKDGVVSVDDYK